MLLLKFYPFHLHSRWFFIGIKKEVDVLEHQPLFLCFFGEIHNDGLVVADINAGSELAARENDAVKLADIMLGRVFVEDIYFALGVVAAGADDGKLALGLGYAVVADAQLVALKDEVGIFRFPHA